MTEPTYTRKGVNIILRRIHQRAQIMTWSLDEKRTFLAQHNISMVINFWSKLDADMSECPVTYIYVPTPHSKDMLAMNNTILAEFVSKWLVMNPESNVLVLCEAGKTRSVFFCVLLVSLWQDITLVEALKLVTRVIPGHRLKQFMLDYIRMDV